MTLKQQFNNQAWYNCYSGNKLGDKRKQLNTGDKFYLMKSLTTNLSNIYFFKQWQQLKAYAHKQGIKIIGDLPIFVAHDSADVWGSSLLV